MLLKESYLPQDLDFAGKLGVRVVYCSKNDIGVTRAYIVGDVLVKELLGILGDGMKPFFTDVGYFGVPEERKSKMLQTLERVEKLSTSIGHIYNSRKNLIEVMVSKNLPNVAALDKADVDEASTLFDELEAIISSEQSP